MSTQPTYWWCLEHKRVERDGGCGGTSRVGPYETEQQAAEAPDRLRARTAEQQARDKAEGKD